MSSHPFFDEPPPVYSAGATPGTEHQIANAANYLAHQSFHIRKALERIAAALEKKNP